MVASTREIHRSRRYRAKGPNGEDFIDRDLPKTPKERKSPNFLSRAKKWFGIRPKQRKEFILGFPPEDRTELGRNDYSEVYSGVYPENYSEDYYFDPFQRSAPPKTTDSRPQFSGMSPQRFFSSIRESFPSKKSVELSGLPKGEDLIDREASFYDWNTIGNDYRKPLSPEKPLIKNHINYMKKFGVKFLRYVGTETFGHLYRCQLRNGAFITSKVISLSKFDLNKWRLTLVKEAVRAMYHEISFLRGLSHPNIIKFFCDIRIPDSKTKFPYSSVCLLMEPTDGSLSDLIQRSTARLMIEEDCIEWFSQICEAIHFLHIRNMVHMNIRPESIRFVIGGYKLFRYKLSDFCYSYQFDDSYENNDVFSSNQVRIEGRYQSPEVRGVGLQMEYFEAKPNDIWGLGVTLIASLIGLQTDPQVMIDGLRYRKWEHNRMYLKYMPYPPSPHLTQLITSMVQIDANHRPKIQELLFYCKSFVYN